MFTNIPLAERLRPGSLDEYVGQKHLVGSGAPLRKIIESGKLPSFIMWGPPGVGKTTLAKIISKTLERPFYTLSAVSSGVKDVREVIEKAKKQVFFSAPNPLLFIDEIHRFSKSQQDSLLGAVEEGVITLIGATTENPSFEVIPALLSRCRIYTLEPLTVDDFGQLLLRVEEKAEELKNREFCVKEKEALFLYSGGDARKFYNNLEVIIHSFPKESPVVIDDQLVIDVLQQQLLPYDKNGEMHYDIISAFIKSIRGSDPNAAVYWLARMIEGGEDLKFIARRLLILAAEDVGLANPNALLIANQCFAAVNVIGYPESRIILSETVIYLANSPKSNSAYMAINKAQSLVKQTGNLPVPIHLRNAPTSLMKEMGYGENYKYSHNYKDNFVEQNYFPDSLQGTEFYLPQDNPQERKAAELMKARFKKKQ